MTYTKIFMPYFIAISYAFSMLSVLLNGNLLYLLFGPAMHLIILGLIRLFETTTENMKNEPKKFD